MMTREEVFEALRSVRHPAQGDRSIEELGMIHNVSVEEASESGAAPHVVVTLGFPKRRDPLAEYLKIH